MTLHLALAAALFTAVSGLNATPVASTPDIAVLSSMSGQIGNAATASR